MRKYKRPKIYIEYLLSNLLLTVFIVLLLVGFIMSYFSMKEHARQLERAFDILTMQRDWIDERILDSEKLIYALQNEDAYANVCRVRPPYDVTEIDQTIHFTREFSKYRLLQSNFENITVYLSESELFLDSNNAGFSPEIFYASHYSDIPMSYCDWKTRAMTAAERITIDETYSQATGKHVYRLYNRSNQNMFDNPSLLILTFAQNPYIQLIKNTDFYEGSKLYVLDKSKASVYIAGNSDDAPPGISEFSTGDTVTVNRSKYTVVEVHSEVASFQYVWLVPDSIFRQQAKGEQRTLLLTGLLMALGFITVAVYFAYKSSQPVYEFVKKFASKNDGSNAGLLVDSRNLNNSLEKILRKNSFLRDELLQYINISKKIFFTKLLNGIPMSQLEITSINEHLNQFLYYKRYCVALVYPDIGESSNPDIIRMMTEEAIRENSPQYSYVVQTEIQHFAIIFAFEQDKHDLPEAGLKKLFEALERHGIVRYTCILSEFCEIPEQLYHSYQSCCQLLDTLKIQGTVFQEAFIRLADSDGTGPGYYYPIFEEHSLVNCIIGKKYEDAVEQIQRLFRKNYESRKITAKERGFFVENVCTTFLRVLGSVEDFSMATRRYVEESIRQVRQVHNGEIICREFISIIRHIESNRKETPLNKGILLCNKMEQMIYENYSDPDFSIADIAQKLNLSENYTSVIFRQYSDKSIAATLESVRMNKAGELVKETNRYIKEIAEQTGYININTFYKAFKRYYGVTPSEYRKINQEV